jgi:hypothetical protein
MTDDRATKSRLMVALDTPAVARACELADKATIYGRQRLAIEIGLQLIERTGIAAAGATANLPRYPLRPSLDHLDKVSCGVAEPVGDHALLRCPSPLRRNFRVACL